MLYEISWNFITAIARLDYHNDICETRNKCKKYKLQGIIVCLLPPDSAVSTVNVELTKNLRKMKGKIFFFLLQGIEFFKQPEVEDIEV